MSNSNPWIDSWIGQLAVRLIEETNINSDNLLLRRPCVLDTRWRSNITLYLGYEQAEVIRQVVKNLTADQREELAQWPPALRFTTSAMHEALEAAYIDITNVYSARLPQLGAIAGLVWAIHDCLLVQAGEVED